MNSVEFRQAIDALSRIPTKSLEEFLRCDGGEWIGERIQLARAALQETPMEEGQAPNLMVDILTVMGAQILSDPSVGPLVRAMVIRSLPVTKWRKLRVAYNELRGKKSAKLHGNHTQSGSGADVVASYWRQGSFWASQFCEISGLPPTMASRRPNALRDDETVEATRPLPPLHDFQEDVYTTIRALLSGPNGQTAILSLPTGAGKTRVAVEALVDHVALLDRRSQRNSILWIAQSEELLLQAWDCFRQVWQTPPQRRDGKVIERQGLLSIRRAWGGGLEPSEMDLDEGPTVFIAGIQQLHQWINHAKKVPPWPTPRFAAVIVDEAHRLVTRSHRDVLVALGLRKKNHWEPLQNSPPVIGLTATPWRTQEDETGSLMKYFSSNLLRPEVLGPKPIGKLQREAFLSRIEPAALLTTDIPEMTPAQLRRFEQFHDLPDDYLQTLGRYPKRNALILARLLKLPREASVLVFACSVEHANILTLALNRAGRVARCVTGETPRHERLSVLEAFRAKEVGFVCNVGVLTTGFDAPKIDAVCIARPTASAVLYEQMVGRGLRGPKNGGTKSCLVLDVQDKGLPQGIMSYGRVLKLWDA